MTSIDEPLPSKLMTAFQKSVEAHFTGVAEVVGARLSALSPSEYSFSTEHAVVVIGVYYGHFPGFCVTLRERHQDRRLAPEHSMTHRRRHRRSRRIFGLRILSTRN
jgi:hypothetical protein